MSEYVYLIATMAALLLVPIMQRSHRRSCEAWEAVARDALNACETFQQANTRLEAVVKDYASLVRVVGAQRDELIQAIMAAELKAEIIKENDTPSPSRISG